MVEMVICASRRSLCWRGSKRYSDVQIEGSMRVVERVLEKEEKCNVDKESRSQGSLEE